MSSHGIPRSATTTDRSAEARKRELKEIEVYQQLVEEIDDKIKAKDYSPELLSKTAELLKRNPEYYTIWNHRRRIFADEFERLDKATSSGQLAQETKISQTLEIINLDLQFLFPLLLKFPKCYWIWNHRLWLLNQSTTLLPVKTARQIWQAELVLVGKMLSRDGRNFHGWEYRRRLIESLESRALEGASMARSEFDYTTKMVSANLSNFSAWHNRIQLVLRFLKEEGANTDERQRMLDQELELIHKALFDPYDQSLWFYHQCLMSTFDSIVSEKTIAPDLTREQRLTYVTSEQDFLEELLDDAADCKWVYQALIETTFLRAKLEDKGLPTNSKNIEKWVQQLKKLDPLRSGRWIDLEKSLTRSQGLEQ